MEFFLRHPFFTIGAITAVGMAIYRLMLQAGN